MTDEFTPTIEVSALSKQFSSATFRRGGVGARSVQELIVRYLGGRAPHTPASFEPSFALREVSFSVAPGEAVAVLGENGSGKSTLLRILAGISMPSAGSVRVRGRVTPVLGSGVGMHGRLTGRENIFLYGALLGMQREEIERQFDAIVAFAGLADFLDTFVQYFPAGMGARLAFSVATHLDADVLLLDEVLAVGDVAFQERSVARLKAIVDRGCAVLLVSHDVARVVQLCSRGIVLKRGELAYDGTISQAVCEYETNSNQVSAGYPR